MRLSSKSAASRARAASSAVAALTAWGGFAVPAFIFVYCVLQNGVPALRHDWTWHASPSGFGSYIMDGMSGWTEGGFGATNLHLDGYLAVPFFALIGAIFGAQASFMFAILLIAVLASFVALQLTPRCADPFLRFGLTALLLLNPWTYNEIVAGHINMVIAAIGFIGAIGLCRNRSDSACIALFICVSSMQIQFAVLAFPLALFVLAVQRRPLPMFVWFTVNLPILIGVIANEATLSTIPINMDWQRNNSVAMFQAIVLKGYAANYTSRAGWALTAPALVVACAAGCTAIANWRSAAVRCLTFVGFSIVLFVSAAKGPMAPIYYFALLHFRAIGVFRELYDLVAIVLAVFALLLSSREAPRFAAAALAIAGAMFCFAWVNAPPAQWWLNTNQLPALAIHQAPGTRFVLLPAFQPLEYGSRGSGADPDVYSHGNAVSPLNQYYPSFPGAVAIARYERSGDTSALAYLGVTDVYNRYGYQSDVKALALQNTQSPTRGTTSAFSHRSIRHAVRLLSAWPLPKVVASVPSITSNEVFYGDVASLSSHDAPRKWSEMRAPATIEVPVRTMDPSRDWIDARLDFLADPALGEPFGGAMTDSSSQALSINGTYVLASVAGKINGKAVFHDSGYRWYSVPTRSIVCTGKCVVALQSTTPPPRLDESSSAIDSGKAVSWRRIAPFLILTSHPCEQVLRFNESFDRGWIAVSDGRILPHFRVAGVANAWLIPHGSCGNGSVLIVQVTSVLQAAAELVGLAVFAIVAVLALRSKCWNLGY